MGKYKYGKPNKEISIEEFIEFLNTGFFVKVSHKAFFVLIFWIGCRRSEPLKVKKEDITEKEGSLFIDVPAFKHGQRGGKIELPMDLPGVMYLFERWKRTRKNRRIFPFTSQTAWRIIKRLDPKISPHWLRHNRITKFRKLRDKGKLSTDQIKAWTGIKSDKTIEHYGMQTQEHIHYVSKILKVKLD